MGDCRETVGRLLRMCFPTSQGGILQQGGSKFNRGMLTSVCDKRRV